MNEIDKKIKESQVIEHSTTFIGLHEWLTHQFTNLGWMILAKHENKNDKLYSYLKSNERLLAQIEKSISSYTDTDKVRDLNILKSKISHLIEITTKLFKDFESNDTIIEHYKNQLGGAKKSSKKSSKKTTKKSSKKTTKKSSKKMTKKSSKK
jgi:hypothetical protein